MHVIRHDLDFVMSDNKLIKKNIQLCLIVEVLRGSR